MASSAPKQLQSHGPVRVTMPCCPKDELPGRGRPQDVWPWQQVATKIKYHPFSSVAGVGWWWWCAWSSLPVSRIPLGQARRVLSCRRSLWALGRTSKVQTPVACLSQNWSQDLSLQKRVSGLCCSLGQLQQEDPHFVLGLSGLWSPEGQGIACHLALSAIPRQRLDK